MYYCLSHSFFISIDIGYVLSINIGYVLMYLLIYITLHRAITQDE